MPFLVKPLLSCAGLALLVMGCASVPPHGGFSSVQDQVQQRLGQQLSWRQNGPEDQAIDDLVADLLQAELTDTTAVQIALLNNRRLQASYAELGISQAAVAQAGRLSNPRLSGDYLLPTNPGGGALVALDLALNFTDWLFLNRHRAMAEIEFTTTKARVAAAVLDLAGATRQAFWLYQGAQEILAQQRLFAAAAAASLTTTQKLYEAGNLPKVALAKAQADAGQAGLALAKAQTRLAAQREELNQLLGLWGPATSAWEVSDQLPPLPDLEPLPEDLERQVLAASLDLAIAHGQLMAAARQAGVAKLESLLADWEIGVAGDRESDGTWHAGPSLSLTLPLFDQGQPRQVAAWARLQQAMDDYTALAIELRAASRMARTQVLAAHEQARYYRDDLLPAYATIVQEMQLSYNGMLVGVFTLMSARRDEITATIEAIAARRDYWLVRSHLDLLLAGRMTPAAMADETRPMSHATSTQQEH